VNDSAPEQRPAGLKSAAGGVVGMLDRPAGIRQFTLIGLFSLGLLYTIHVAKPVLIPVMLAMLLNFIFKPSQRLLIRLGLNRVAAATLILFGILGVIAVGGYTLATPFVDWVERIPANVRQADAKLDRVTGAIKRLGAAAQQVEEITDMQESGSRPSIEIRERRFTQTVFEVAQQLFVFLMLSLILLFFMLVYGDILLDKLSAAGGTLEVLSEIHDYMSKYLLTITTINAVLGLCVMTAMYLLGMPNPMLWGAMAMLLNFIPYLGAWVGVGTITLVSLVTFESTAQIVSVPFIYFLLTSTEGNFITPIILGQRFTLNPIVIFVWLIFWGWIWGVAGAFIAVPLLVAFRILCDHVESLRPIGEFITITKEDERKTAAPG
jgi:predicted PurR-regulated permease PerM